MKARKYTGNNPAKLSDFPNFHITGSITGMKRMYYGKNALLVKHGNYIYNVSSSPDIYYNESIW